MYAQLDRPEQDAYTYAIEVMAASSQTPEAQEGMTAFLENATPPGPPKAYAPHPEPVHLGRLTEAPRVNAPLRHHHQSGSTSSSPSKNRRSCSGLRCLYGAAPLSLYCSCASTLALLRTFDPSFSER